MDMKELVRGQFKQPQFEEKAQELAAEAETIRTYLAGEFERIDRDGDLTPQGKQKAKRRAYEQAKDRLDGLQQQREQFETLRERTLGKLVEDDAPDPSDPATMIRQREIRDLLRNKSEGEVLRIYREAASNGDLETVKAIEDAPTSFPMVQDQDSLRRLRDERLEKKFPDEMQKAHDQEAVARIVDTAHRYLERNFAVAAEE